MCRNVLWVPIANSKMAGGILADLIIGLPLVLIFVMFVSILTVSRSASPYLLLFFSES